MPASTSATGMTVGQSVVGAELAGDIASAPTSATPITNAASLRDGPARRTLIRFLPRYERRARREPPHQARLWSSTYLTFKSLLKLRTCAGNNNRGGRQSSTVRICLPDPVAKVPWFASPYLSCDAAATILRPCPQ